MEEALRQLPGWTWKGGESYYLGSHLNGRRADGSTIIVYDLSTALPTPTATTLTGFSLEISAPDERELLTQILPIIHATQTPHT